MTVAVGQRVQRILTLTTDHMKTFAALTGDYNPLHFDETFARRTKFQELVVQGGLTTGLLHAPVAMDLTGPGSVDSSMAGRCGGTWPPFISRGGVACR